MSKKKMNIIIRLEGEDSDIIESVKNLFIDFAYVGSKVKNANNQKDYEDAYYDYKSICAKLFSYLSTIKSIDTSIPNENKGEENNESEDK